MLFGVTAVVFSADPFAPLPQFALIQIDSYVFTSDFSNAVVGIRSSHADTGAIDRATRALRTARFSCMGGDLVFREGGDGGRLHPPARTAYVSTLA